MSPALKALAERAIAAGAPEADDHTVIVIPGVSLRSVLTGLVYDRPTRLPLLSDSSWLGWATEETERRGWRFSLQTWNKPKVYRCHVWRHINDGINTVGDAPECIVAMLEATQ